MSSPESTAKYGLPLAVGLLLFLSLFRLGAVTLFDVDEAVFSEATKEMVQSGDWVTPTYNGVNRYDKPIFFYWVMAASYKIFGINEFGARFPSALAGILLCLSLYLFVKRTVGADNAWYAALCFMLSLYYLMYSHAAVTDMTLTLFITLSLFSFFLSLQKRTGETASRRWLYLFYLFSGLAFLTKGLIGILFPFGIAGLYLLTTERLKGVRRMISPVGMILFLLVSGPWYFAEFAANGREFIDQFFIKHHFERYTGTISGHRGPVFYYLAVLALGLFPWAAFLPAGILRAFRKSPQESGNFASGRTPDESRSLPLFSFIWLAFIFIFFSIATTKLPNYILPSAPAAAILIAFGISSREPFWLKFSNGFAALLALLLGAGFLFSNRYLIREGIDISGWIYLFAAILFVLSALSLSGLLRRKTPVRSIAAVMLIFLIVLSVKGLPLASQQLQGPLYKFSLYAKERLGDGEKLIVYRLNNPSIVFYSDHHIVNAGSPDQLASLLKDGHGLLVIAKTKDMEVFKGIGLDLIEKDGKYALLEKK